MDWEGTIVTNIQTFETPEGDMKDNAFYVGWHYMDFEYSDVCNTREFTNQYQGTSGNDVFYQFGLEVPMDIILSHCGSEVDETFIYLLDSEGNCIASSAEFPAMRIAVTRRRRLFPKRTSGRYVLCSLRRL